MIIINTPSSMYVLWRWSLNTFVYFCLMTCFLVFHTAACMLHLIACMLLHHATATHATACHQRPDSGSIINLLLLPKYDLHACTTCRCTITAVNLDHEAQFFKGWEGGESTHSCHVRGCTARDADSSQHRHDLLFSDAADKWIWSHGWGKRQMSM